jgi:glyoxylase-like metal-dependent hydrolase (beta-lactamase superfamily II)
LQVEADYTLQLASNGGWDPRIEIVEVGDLVRSHILYCERFTVVYDTLLGPRSGGFLAQRVAQRAPDKPVLVVVSHSDWDHCWGNQCFSAPILGLDLCAERMLGEFGQGELAKKRAEHESYASVQIVAPNVRLSGEARLEGGDLTLQLLHTQGHRPDHLAIYIPEIKTLLAGDQVETPFSLMDEDCQGMLASLERFLQLPVDWLLCNHAPPGQGLALVEHNLRYYQNWLSQAADADSLEQLLQRVPFEGGPDFYRDEHQRIGTAIWNSRSVA